MWATESTDHSEDIAYKKQKQYCNKFYRDFKKNGPQQKQQQKHLNRIKTDVQTQAFPLRSLYF